MQQTGWRCHTSQNRCYIGMLLVVSRDWPFQKRQSCFLCRFVIFRVGCVVKDMHFGFVWINQRNFTQVPSRALEFSNTDGKSGGTLFWGGYNQDEQRSKYAVYNRWIRLAKGWFSDMPATATPVRRYWYNRDRIRVVKGVQNEKDWYLEEVI